MGGEVTFVENLDEYSFPPGMTGRVTEQFKDNLKKAGDKLVVVDFTATWCGPCRAIAPYYEELSTKPENANVIFLKVDVDEAEKVAEENGITSMPTFIFYKNGKEVDRFSGADKDKLSEKLEAYRT